jgi:hypothetical protein
MHCNIAIMRCSRCCLPSSATTMPIDMGSRCYSDDCALSTTCMPLLPCVQQPLNSPTPTPACRYRQPPMVSAYVQFGGGGGEHRKQKAAATALGSATHFMHCALCTYVCCCSLQVQRQPLLSKYLVIREGEQQLRKAFKSPAPGAPAQSHVSSSGNNSTKFC